MFTKILLALQAAFILSGCSHAAPSSNLVKRGSPTVSLQVNNQNYDDYCVHPNPSLTDRHACFQIAVDIRKQMMESHSLFGFMKDDGNGFVVLADLPQAGPGPWSFKTQDRDVTIRADDKNPSCLLVDIVPYDFSGGDDRDTIDGDHITTSEQCLGSSAIQL